MKATNRIKRESKRNREDSDLIFYAVQFTLKSVAISLYEIYGFHNKRGERVLQDAVDRVCEFTRRYGSDCVDEAMNKLLQDYKIDMTLRER